MLRMLWNGTLSFGLVQAPVALYPASRRDKLGFDLLDRRTMDRVGYRRINRETGEEVAPEDVVKGYRYADARYAVLSDEEIQAAADHPGHPAHSVDVLAFVERGEIPAMFYEAPYYLAPGEGGGKAYALLRETLRRSGKVGIAQVVIRTRRHLAAIMPCGPALVLNTLRWETEVQPFSELDLPGENAAGSGVTEAELAMAERLADSMTRHWDPAQYHDSFRADIMALIRRKIGESRMQPAAHAPDAAEPAGAADEADEAADFTAALMRSLSLAGASASRQRESGDNARRDAAQPAHTGK